MFTSNPKGNRLRPSYSMKGRVEYSSAIGLRKKRIGASGDMHIAYCPSVLEFLTDSLPQPSPAKRRTRFCMFHRCHDLYRYTECEVLATCAFGSACNIFCYLNRISTQQAKQKGGSSVAVQPRKFVASGIVSKCPRVHH